MILNASAENGSSSAARRVVVCARRGRLPATGGMSTGDGQVVDHRVEQRLHALVLEAPRRSSTGTARPAMVARRSAARSSLLGDRLAPRGRRAITSSSTSAIASIIACARAARPRRRSSAGISAIVGARAQVARPPRRSPSCSIRSTTPVNSSSRPIGIWIDDRRRPRRRSRICSHAAIGIGADAVALVDEGDARHVVAVGLAPHRLGLRLDAADGAEHRHRAVEHAQAALDLDGEVDVARACR